MLKGKKHQLGNLYPNSPSKVKNKDKIEGIYPVRKIKLFREEKNNIGQKLAIHKERNSAGEGINEK